MSDASMQLPEGKTCADCAHCKRCTSMFGARPENVTCDWAPSRFYQKPDEDEPPHFDSSEGVKVLGGLS